MARDVLARDLCFILVAIYALVSAVCCMVCVFYSKFKFVFCISLDRGLLYRFSQTDQHGFPQEN